MNDAAMPPLLKRAGWAVRDTASVAAEATVMLAGFVFLMCTRKGRQDLRELMEEDDRDEFGPYYNPHG